MNPVNFPNPRSALKHLFDIIELLPASISVATERAN
jgi:hypothetical protein